MIHGQQNIKDISPLRTHRLATLTQTLRVLCVVRTGPSNTVQINSIYLSSIAKYKLSSRFVNASLVYKHLRVAFLAHVYPYHASYTNHVAIDSVTF
jgi:hypothetical protein